MFNKKEAQDGAPEASATNRSEPPPRTAAPARTGGQVATIGPSIRIDGDLQGDEDLVVEGRVTGTVQLRSNTLTIGSQGEVKARVYAHTILVEGKVNGDLYASERISIRESARIEGNIYAPRISLDDGARFRGAIDMDTETESFRKAFGNAQGAASSSKSAASSSKSAGEPSGNGSSDRSSSSAGSTKPAAANSTSSAA
ncbi:polymer-forming cytoskeletal protein [Halomonas denitrificans]|nr:polymer-forming cytoskeletal protein [Halomonas denitrificans]